MLILTGSSLPLLPQIQKHTLSQVSSHTLNHMNSSIYKGAQKEQDELNQICFGMVSTTEGFLVIRNTD